VEGGGNGGFPEPLAGEAVRLVRCEHDACGAATRVRLPRELPAKVVRRVVCDGCREPFQCDHVLDMGVAWPPRLTSTQARLTRTQVPGWPFHPEGRAWRYLSVPVAAAAVIGVMALIQGSGESARQSASSTAPAAPEPPFKSPAGPYVVNESIFALALPPGWHRTSTKNNAAFAAAASEGGANATLWILLDPKLDFPAFESRSQAHLEALAGSAQVVDHATAPTAEGTVVTLATDSRPGEPAYVVTLRAAGPYRYYLATTVEPSAPREAVEGAELIHSSFVPVAGGGTGQ
jgi:hypothetical protein